MHVRGMIPLVQSAAVAAVQWVSCTRTTVSLLRRGSSSRFFPITHSESRSTSQRVLQDAKPVRP
eukprot:11208943-Lingulodinium_polyedra.AAC.1